MWAQEQLHSTCLFGSSYNSKGQSSYSNSWQATNGNFTWNIVNANNNNNGWSYIKIGNTSTALVGSITTAAAYDVAITKVVLTIDDIAYPNSLTSIKLHTSTNGSTWTEVGSFNKELGEQTVSLSSPTEGLYYKIEFVCTAATKNGVIQVSKVEYYYEGSGGGETTDPDPGTEPEVKGYYKKITSMDELEDGKYLIVYEAGNLAFDGSTKDGSTTSPVDKVSNYINVTVNDGKIISNETVDAATFTIDLTAGTIKSAAGYYIGQTSDANGLASSTTTTYKNTITFETNGDANIVSSGGAYLRYNATSGQTRFRYYSSKTYTGQKAVALYKYVETVDVKVSKAGWATWVAPRNVRFDEGEAYTVKVIGDVANLTNVTEIPANTAVVLKGEQGTEVTVTATVIKDNVVLETANDLKASKGEVVGNGKIYVLANKDDKVGFYLLKEESTLPSGKAYLELEDNQEVRGFIGFNDNETTGISTTLMNNEAKNNEYYNLAGQRVAQPTKGLYIVNGKKLIIK